MPQFFFNEVMLEEAFVHFENKLSTGEPLAAQEERLFHTACHNFIVSGLQKVQNFDNHRCARCQSETVSGMQSLARLKARQVRRLTNICFRVLDDVDQWLGTPSLSSRARAIFHVIQSDVKLCIYELSPGIKEDRDLTQGIEACRLAQYCVADLPAYDPTRLIIAEHLAMLQFDFMHDSGAAIDIVEVAIEDAEKDILVAERRSLPLTGYDRAEPVRLLNEMKSMLDVWKS